MSVHGDNLKIVFAGWVDALRRNDLETIERHLDPDDELIPFVHVADVARSIAFYELLGLTVEDAYHH